MSATIPLTDMASFEGALDEQWCHVVNGAGAICGGDPGQSGVHMGDWSSERCDGCGRRNCPECRRMLEKRP